MCVILKRITTKINKTRTVEHNLKSLQASAKINMAYKRIQKARSIWYITPVKNDV